MWVIPGLGSSWGLGGGSVGEDVGLVDCGEDKSSCMVALSWVRTKPVSVAVALAEVKRFQVIMSLGFRPVRVSVMVMILLFSSMVNSRVAVAFLGRPRGFARSTRVWFFGAPVDERIFDFPSI